MSVMACSKPPAARRAITWVAAETTAVGSDGRLLAHSDGKIVAVHVQPGDVVSKGQTLLVLEAMKMEFQLALPVDGTVEAISVQRSEEHTSELQSLMRISYAVFCLTKKNKTNTRPKSSN